MFLPESTYFRLIAYICTMSRILIKGNESVSLLKAMKMEINVNRKKRCLFSLGKRMVMMLLLLQGIWMSAAHAVGVGGSGMYQWSVELRGYISNETGKAPVAYLWCLMDAKR